MIKSYLSYRFNCTKASKVNHLFIKRLNHSVFSKLNQINDKEIQNYIKLLSVNKTLLKVTDLGAGSKNTKSAERSIKSIVNSASITPRFGCLLQLLIQEFKCKTVLELGTSLGVGTSYLALQKSTNVYTIEGCPTISGFTQNKLSHLSNVNFYIGEFSSQLNDVLTQSGSPDLIYIDGNHTYNATVNYFEYCIENASPNAILVFDDIHWSRGMEKAWDEIVKSKDVSISIDLFRMGIVFLDQSLDEKDFVLSF